MDDDAIKAGCTEQRSVQLAQQVECFSVGGVRRWINAENKQLRIHRGDFIKVPDMETALAAQAHYFATGQFPQPPEEG